jgi:hypothetical protein
MKTHFGPNLLCDTSGGGPSPRGDTVILTENDSDDRKITVQLPKE